MQIWHFEKSYRRHGEGRGRRGSVREEGCREGAGGNVGKGKRGEETEWVGGGGTAKKEVCSEDSPAFCPVRNADSPL